MIHCIRLIFEKTSGFPVRAPSKELAHHLRSQPLKFGATFVATFVPDTLLSSICMCGFSRCRQYLNCPPDILFISRPLMTVYSSAKMTSALMSTVHDSSCRDSRNVTNAKLFKFWMIDFNCDGSIYYCGPTGTYYRGAPAHAHAHVSLPVDDFNHSELT